MRFFRRPLNPSVGRVPQGTHAVGWGCRENGERVHAFRTYPTCRLRLATFTHFLMDFKIMDEKENSQSTALSIITQALKVPGVKVNREAFLLDTFKVEGKDKLLLLEKGPISSGLISQKEVKKQAQKLCSKRTLTSSMVSFAAGIPGGFAMATTIPTDMLQFLGFNLRIAQEVAYLYGYKDFWGDDGLDIEAVQGEFMLFMATMLGVGGAASATRYISTAVARNIATNLPKQALTKTAWYPILKNLASYIGVKLTKDTAAKSISKVVPILGGIASGAITYVTMSNMTARLYEAFDKAVEYTPQEQREDIEIMKKEMPDVYAAIFKEI